MKFLVVCALIYCLKTVSSQSFSIKPIYTDPTQESVIFAVGKPLVLTCNVSFEGSTTPNNLLTEWKKDGKLISEVDILKNRFKLSNQSNSYSMTIGDSQYGDAGNWSCSFTADDKTSSAAIIVASIIEVKIKLENINVVEEEKLRVECSVLGNPHPILSWQIETSLYNRSSSFDDRVQIQDYVDDKGVKVINGSLIIDRITKDDRGHYYCLAYNRYSQKNAAESYTMVRVKDKYAALWPFLGICAEVIILCAVIIIYEKKRNKTELEESDTDQSPDQKNTPDDGKEANLRHRQ